MKAILAKFIKKETSRFVLKIMTNGLNFENEFDEVKEGQHNSIWAQME